MTHEDEITNMLNEEAQAQEQQAQLDAAQARITALEGVLERMVHWFGRYPEWIPAPDQMENYRAAIADARAVLTQ